MAQTIVVATDGSDPAERAVHEAIEIAARDGARLHIVTAYPDPALFQQRLASGATNMHVHLRDVADKVVGRNAQMAADRGVEVDTHSREGHPAEAILEVAKEQNADLVVVGNRGLSGIRRFLLGSVSLKVSEHADCNVLIVRTD